MHTLRRILAEIAGLFVEDGSFAVEIILWVAVTIVILPVAIPLGWRGPVEFLGLAAILAENVIRTARRSPKK